MTALTEYRAAMDAQGSHPAATVMGVAGGFIASIAVHVVTKVGVAAQLADGPRDVADLAKTCGVDADALHRTLRLLVAVGLFAEPSPRVFAHNAASELLRAGVPGSLRDMVLWWADPLHLRVYAEFEHSLRTGRTCVERVLGLPIFDYLRTDPEESAVFNAAMVAISGQVVPAVLDAYDFSGIGTLVDVGGGHGSVLAAVLARYPEMRGVLADLDHVVAGAGPTLARFGVADRCRAVACDFFASVPGGGDAYILKNIVHDWDDAKSVAILTAIRTALADRPGRVLLIEAVVAPGSTPDLAKFIDLEMLTLPGGRERMEAEYAALFARAGFRLARVVPTRSPMAVIEAVPA